jgi:hypothetical protein
MAATVPHPLHNVRAKSVEFRNSRELRSRHCPAFLDLKEERRRRA